MSLFDQTGEAFFLQRFGLDPANCEHLALIAEEAGASPEEVAAFRSGRLRPGQSFGGARLEDVPRFVRHALFTQGGRSITLRINRPPFDDAGHLEIAVLDARPLDPGGE